MLAARYAGASVGRARDRAQRLLADVGLADRMRHRRRRLSRPPPSWPSACRTSRSAPLFADDAAAVRRLSLADDRAAHDAATAAGARYVDLFSLTRRARDTPGFLSADRFHPSDEGCELMREVWTCLVNRYQVFLFKNANHLAHWRERLTSDEDVSSTSGRGGRRATACVCRSL
jgi:hypothetical protein